VVVYEADPEESVAAPTIKVPSQKVTLPAADEGETVAVRVTAEPRVVVAVDAERLMLDAGRFVREKFAVSEPTVAVTV
jgi:hypothetical protein